MSNPAKALKKVVKAVIVVAAVAAIAYVALPALAGGAGAAGTAVSTGSFTAGNTALVAGGGGVAATTASTGTGLLGALGAGAAKVGGMISGASPMVKLGLIQAGSQALAAGMAPEEQTEAERLQDTLNVYHSQPRESRTYTTTPAQGGYSTQSGIASTPASQYTPQTGGSGGLLGRYNPTTRRWEQSA